MRDKGQEARGKLLPCPFCGGEARTHYVKGYELWEVSCGQCGVEMSAYLSEAEAIEAWNRRTGKGDKLSPVERTVKVEKVTRVSSVIRTGRCGNCGYDVIDSYKHCPNCGARLEWE